jgi:hypothetical protein
MRKKHRYKMEYNAYDRYGNYYASNDDVVEASNPKSAINKFLRVHKSIRAVDIHNLKRVS